MLDQRSYEGIVAKITRANKHIDELETLWSKCRAEHPSKTIIERDPSTGSVTYIVADMTPIPIEAAAIAGDCLQNLRSALDHLACGMVTAAGGEVNRRTSFPIFETAEEYVHPKQGVERRVPGLCSEAREMLDELKPYKGGNDNLWILHSLNNIDKHRLLITFAHRVAASTLPLSERTSLVEMFKMAQPHVPPPRFDNLFINLDNTHNNAPLKIGDKIRTDSGVDAEEEMEFLIGIGLNETGVVRGINLDTLLRALCLEVNQIARSFTRFL